MWYNTDITKIAGIQYPILQGPFGGGLSSPKLVAAVSNAGGLGGYGAYQLQPEEIKTIDTEIKSKTNKPYNINLWVNDADKKSSHYTKEEFDKVAAIYKPFFDELNIPLPQQPQNILSKFEKQVEIIFECKPPVFSFVFGIPDEYILKECRRLGIKTIGAATTLDEAIALEEAKVDMIVATGFEAGGHNGREETTTMVLVPEVCRTVHIPVIAAGGIATGRQMLASMVLGAEGVQIGSRFVASEEASSHTSFKNAVIAAAEGDTMLMMKNLTPVRLLKNEFYKKVQQAEAQCAPADELKQLLGRGRAKKGMFEGDLTEGELEIGQVSASIKSVMPAAAIVNEIWNEFELLLKQPLK